MKIAIVGASGAVGQEFLKILEEHNLRWTNSYFSVRSCSAGRKYTFRGEELTVKLLQHNDDFRDIDIALVSGRGRNFARVRPIR